MNNLDLAVSFALSSNRKRKFRMACLALRKDGAMVVAINGKTTVKTPSAHAEARVLHKAGYGSILWVARVTNDGLWAMARPCPFCQVIIRTRGVKKVYYTISPNEYGVWDLGRFKNP